MNQAPVEFLDARRRALGRRLASEPVEAMLVTHRPNIAYLTHFFGSAGYLVAAAEHLTLISDARYAARLSELVERVPELTVEVVRPGEGSLDERLVSVLARLGVARLGFESAHLTVGQFEGLKWRLAAAGSQADWRGLDQAIEALRAVKDRGEVAVFREAGRRLSDVSKCIIPNALAGVTERHMAAIIDWELRQKGFDGPAFDTIVASGPNAAVPHHRAGDRVLADGDLVILDFGGMLQGYAVDMTRTLTIGRGPTGRQQHCWDTVAAAQRAAFAASLVGAAAEDVDGAARSVIEAAGMGEAFVHGLGHGLGLEVHEQPRLTKRRPGASSGALEAGMVFTLEPGVYVPGWGGVRIEDDVVATETGPEWLTEPVTEVRAT